MNRHAKNSVPIEEHAIGTEDVIFLIAPDEDGRFGGWYWQARGSSDCYGPFDSRETAAADYESC